MSDFRGCMSIHRLIWTFWFTGLAFLGWTSAWPQVHKTTQTEKAGPDYSGMYSFLRDGEFVQVSVEQGRRVTGFVSRYGDTESDRGVFLDHFFKEGKLDGNQLSFTTDTVHGVSFEFHGSVERGEGKNPGDEAYYVLKGTLIENSMDDGKRISSHPRQVALKIFPQDLGSGAEKK
jgi:hypothetical protein